MLLTIIQEKSIDVKSFKPLQTLLVFKIQEPDNNLCRTAIRISFPEMKDEVFINLLGYKEPNLVHLLRCKVS